MAFANENKRNLWNSVRLSFVIFIAAMIKTGFPMKLDKFVTSVCFAVAAVLPSAGVHVGEIISKTIINMVVCILGALLGHGLRKLPKNEIGEVLLLVLFIMIALGIFGRSLIKKVKDGYDYAPTAFLMAACVTLGYPSVPDVWLTEFVRNIEKTLVSACGLIILSAFLPPFFAGDEVHNEIQENIHILADTFGDLKEKCFGLSQNLQNNLQSLINSKEKENSLGKFVCWEPRRHPQEQYEKIGDCIRLCASYTLSLTNLENVQFSPDLQEKCKEIWSELAKALTSLYDSMKHKTTPAASIDNTLELTAPVLKLASHPENKVELRNAVLNLASHPEKTVELIAALKLTSYQEGIHITPHLFEKLVSSTKELDSNVSELLTGGESHQRFIPGIQEVATRANQLVVAPMKNMVSWLFASLKKLILKCSSVFDGPDTTQPHDSEPQREEDKLGQVAIDIDLPPGPIRVK